MSYRTTRAFERHDTIAVPREIWTDLFTRYAASVFGMSTPDFKELVEWWEETGERQYLDSFN